MLDSKRCFINFFCKSTWDSWQLEYVPKLRFVTLTSRLISLRFTAKLVHVADMISILSSNINYMLGVLVAF